MQNEHTDSPREAEPRIFISWHPGIAVQDARWLHEPGREQVDPRELTTEERAHVAIVYSAHTFPAPIRAQMGKNPVGTNAMLEHIADQMAHDAVPHLALQIEQALREALDLPSKEMP